ncbi:MAG: TonB-dependent receptor [Bacteroidota bacterium]
MKKIFYINLLSLLFPFLSSAQILSGTVANEAGEFLYGATVMWEETDLGTVADENGYFELPKMDTAAYLMIDYVGYDPVYVEVLPEETNLEIAVGGINELIEVQVAAARRDNYVSTLSTLNQEVLSAGEFRKAPCCSLAESFQTNASIDVAYTDAVTGAREIQLLGLRGTYTQLLVEKRPIHSGLASAFVMEYIPGTWLNSLQISKGTSTVQNGYQAITGQINSELVKPFEDKKMFLNIYGSTFGRGEINLHLNRQLTDKWSTGVLLHTSRRKNKLDYNDDTFYDTPQKAFYDGLLRTFYWGDELRGQFNFHVISDRRTGGQIASEANLTPYAITQNNDRIEFFGKMGYIGFKNPAHSIGLIADAFWHELDARYGNQHHQGTQRGGYLQAMFSNGFGGDKHQMDVGVSYNYDDFDEMLNDMDVSRTESVPGVYVEYSYTPLVGKACESEEEKAEQNKFVNKFGAVVGMRLDQHNLFGTLFTPRVNLKYNFSTESVVRISAGRGYRTANVIAENLSVLASNRTIAILDNLDIEDAWNFGFNFTQNFKLAKKEASLAVDIYRTEFVNQVVLDVDSDFQLAQFYNLDGRSFSNSLLAVFSYQIFKGLDFKMAYKFNDVRVTFQDGELRERPMVARHRGLLTLDYVTPNEKWEFNINTQLVGKQRFAHLWDNPYHTADQHIGETPSYMLLNAQFSYKFNDRFEIYSGSENITGFRQEDAIINWQDPFGDYFDAAHVYAPITGTMMYFGIRYGIE